MRYKKLRWHNSVALLLFCGIAIAQVPAYTFIHLKDAIGLAEQRYHLLKAGKFKADAPKTEIISFLFWGLLRLPGLPLKPFLQPSG